MARKPKSPKDYPTRVDEEEEEQQAEGRGPSAIRSLLTPVFPGLRNIWRRFGGQKPPRIDPNQSQVWYRPSLRVVEWDGEANLHTEGQECVLPHCHNPGERGRHSELRKDGFDWCGRHFSCLVEGLENQAFADWYENGWFEGVQGERGKDVMAKGKMVLRPALYPRNEEPPLPEYNFFLDEHIDEMTAEEIRLYKAKGEVPKRLRRRGRAKKR